MRLRCPMCKKELEVPDDYETRPFCSPRCKKLDLANWLEGAYSLPRPLSSEELASLPPETQEEILKAALGAEPKDRLN